MSQIDAGQLSGNTNAASVVEVRLGLFGRLLCRLRRRHSVSRRLHFGQRRRRRRRRSLSMSGETAAGAGEGVVQPGGKTDTRPAGKLNCGCGRAPIQRWKNNTRRGTWNSASSSSSWLSCRCRTDLTLNVRTVPCRSTPRYQRRRRRRLDRPAAPVTGRQRENCSPL